MRNSANIKQTAPAASVPEALRPVGMLEVSAAVPSKGPDALADAVAVVAVAAAEHRIGILISRIGEDRYIVRAHPSVPYGLVRQSLA
ncbi:hypothetical protein [Arthrobacter sp. Leaf137]|uniref:hypothetical protein n=1 Tax=Arthrobacter sp. Leaf137 TaxID=1736271 RepID=UPI0006F7CC5A|nr:hypothetical protein [Arthrobacter sp. Leaf137]KQQ83425.1 hypothetical protein ASF64_07440 [Arthrobacter sp. Leaf137]